MPCQGLGIWALRVMRGSRKRTRFGREKIEIADCYNRREGFGRAFLFWFFMLVLVLLGGRICREAVY